VVALDDVSVAVVAEAGKPVFVRVLATLEVVELGGSVAWLVATDTEVVDGF
jgi:hypothetical protein